MTLIVCIDLPDLSGFRTRFDGSASPTNLESSSWSGVNAPERALDFLDDVGAIWRKSDSMVVVRPPQRPDLEAMINSVASITDSERVIDVPLGRTPLSAGCAAQFVADLTYRREIAAGLVPGLLRRAESQLSVSSLLASTASLTAARSTVRQHARSYLPRARFIVQLGTRNQVRTIKRRVTATEIARAVAPAAHQLVVTTSPTTPAWMSDVVDAADRARVSSHVAVGTDHITTGWWGGKSVTEIVGLAPVYASELGSWHEKQSQDLCVWCVQQTDARACPTCGHSASQSVEI